MDTQGNVSSQVTGVKLQKKKLQGQQLMRMNKQMVKKQQVEADIKLKSASSKYVMQLQLEHKTMGALQVNSWNKIKKNMRFQ